MNVNAERFAIIFDLGGVLFDTDTRTIVSRAGSLFHESITPDKVKLFFRELAQIKPIMNHTVFGRNEDGHAYPPLLNDFLAGVPSTQILEHIVRQGSMQPQFLKLAQALFNPDMLAMLYTLIPQGEQFVKECERQGYPLYILSNWDIDSFPLVRKKHASLFDLFSGILISGECHLIKPDPAIFKLLLQQYTLQPQSCFFIDNQQENVRVAQELGFQGILCPTGDYGPNFDEIRRTLAMCTKK